MDITPLTTPNTKLLNLNLDVFEGPLDVLLHLIQEKNIDVFDIPIYQIAEEFQKYVDLAQHLDLERAGEYLSTSAELAFIKSKMLLPKSPNDTEDPRQELVDRLLEHEQLQHVTSFLKESRHLGHDVFVRGGDPSEGLPEPPPAKADMQPLDLLHIFDNLLKKVPRAPKAFHEVRRETMSVRQRILWISQQMKNHRKISFTELLSDSWERSLLIVTFLALLELSRLRKIQLSQLNDNDILLETIGDLDDLPLHEVENFTSKLIPKTNKTNKK